MTDQDSFQRYKAHLEQTIEMQSTDLRAPKPPMNAFMRFHLERSRQQRCKNPKANWLELSKSIAQEWKNLPEKEKEYYELQAAFRRKERERLLEEFNRITKKRKVLSPYCKYFQKMYPIYQKEFPEHTSQQISKMIGNEWVKLDQSKKKAYIQQAQKQKLLLKRTQIPIQDIDTYKQSLARYHEQLSNQTNKILRLYPYTKPSKRQQRSAQRTRKWQQKRQLSAALKRQRDDDRLRRIRQKQEAKVRRREEKAKARIERKQMKRDEQRRRAEEKKEEKRRAKEEAAERVREQKRVEKERVKAEKAAKKEEEKSAKKLAKKEAKKEADKEVVKKDQSVTRKPKIPKKKKVQVTAAATKTEPSPVVQKTQPEAKSVPKKKSAISRSARTPSRGKSSKTAMEIQPPVKELPLPSPRKPRTPRSPIQTKQSLTAPEPSKRGRSTSRAKTPQNKAVAPKQQPAQQPKRGRQVKIEPESPKPIPKTKKIQKKVPRPVPRKLKTQPEVKEEPKSEEKRSTRKRIGKAAVEDIAPVVVVAKTTVKAKGRNRRLA